MKSKILKTLLIIISIFAISISLSVHSIAEEGVTNLIEETSSQTESSNELDNEETNELNNEENEVVNNEETAISESSEEVTSNEGNEEITEEESNEEVVTNNNETEETSEENSSNSENEEVVTNEETTVSDSQELNEENVEETSNNETSSTENTEETEEEEEVVVTTRRLQSTPLRAQGSEDTDDCTFTLFFYENDNTQWNYEGDVSFGVCYIDSNNEVVIPEEIEYSYKWQNGQEGTGIINQNEGTTITQNNGDSNAYIMITLKNIPLTQSLWGIIKTENMKTDSYKVEIASDTFGVLSENVYNFMIPNDRGANVLVKRFEVFDYTFEVNFKDKDGNEWNNSGVTPEFSLRTLNSKATEYTYTWENGETGTGKTRSNILKIQSISEVPGSKVTITLKNVAKDSILGIKNPDKTIFSKIESDGQESDLYSTQPNLFAGMLTAHDIIENDTVSITAYKGNDPVILNAKFINPDGTVHMFEEGENIPDISRSLYRENLEYWNYDKETGIFSKRFYLGDDDELKVYLISLAEGNCIEKLVVDGEELSYPDNQDKILDITPGNVINLDYYMAPRVVTGTVGFYSYDGSITDDYVYSFYFHLMQGASSSYDVTEEDIENAYWTIEGDETKHYGENGGFNVTIPIGKKVTLHNIPIYAMFHMASGWPLDNITFTHFTGENRDRTYVTYKGEDIREYASENYYDIEELGIIPQIFWNYTLQHEAPSIHETYIDTSGSFYYFNLNDGFDINYYLFRTTTQFMIKKELKEDASIEENKKYHFKINLKDQKTGLPFTEKVAYYIYSDSESTVNPDEDVQYAMPDEDGNIDIYLGAGEYARIGRSKPSDYETNLYYGGGRKRRPDELYVKRIYVPGIGMLPSYIDYKIVEIDDGYSYTVSPENGEEGTSETPFWKNDSIYSSERDTINRAGEVTYPAYNAQQMFEYLDGITFTNSRKLGSLTVEKIVEGEDTDKEFNFNIKITDAAISFPLEYDYENSNGETGKITFTAGNKITKETGEFTEYTASVSLKNGESITIKGIPAGAEYEVTEDEESAEGYNTESTGATGTIKADDSEEKSTAVFTNKEIVEEPEEEMPVEKPEEKPVKEEPVEEVKEEPVEEVKEEPVEEVKEEPVEEVEEVKEEKVVSIKTGDMIIISIGIIAIALVGLAVVVVLKKQHDKKENK